MELKMEEINDVSYRCNYKQIDTDADNDNRVRRDYYNYMKLISQQQYIVKQEVLEESEGDQSPLVEEDHSAEISDRDEGDTNEGGKLQQNIKWFLEKSKQNTFKNIINAFYRHVHELKDIPTQQMYEKLTKDQWQFSYISLRVYQNLKKCGRFGLKLKNLLTSPNLKNIFLFFLKNADEFWIRDSKIKQKEPLLQAIDLILKAHEQDCDFLVSNICYYRKQKKLTRN